MEFIIKTLADVVTAYNGGGIFGMRRELAIMKVALTSSLSDKEKAEIVVMGGHQHRLLCQNAASAKHHLIDTLANAKLWSNPAPTSFENLYNKISNLLINNGCRYAGQITRYDFAKRIGTVWGCEPKKFVYLHSGSLSGAQRLLDMPNLKECTQPISVFSSFFPTLNAMEIEDILCVYHNYFIKGDVAIRCNYDANRIQACHILWLSNQTLANLNSVLSSNGLQPIP